MKQIFQAMIFFGFSWGSYMQITYPVQKPDALFGTTYSGSMSNEKHAGAFAIARPK